MLKSILGFFTGGTMQSVERLASEFIETDKESAEAKSIFLKAMDPNGVMRRGLSTFACRAYGFYLIMTVVLIFMSVWGVGGELCQAVDGVKSCMSRADVAADRMTGLFTPITTSWGVIVSASFGVNGMNSYKGN